MWGVALLYGFRQMNGEGAPLIRRAFDGHATPVRLNDVLHDGEPEPRSAEFSAPGLVDS